MFRQRYGNKFGARKTDFNGIRYHSKMEAHYAQRLAWRKAAGDIKGWQRQVRISLDVNGYHIANYYIDFVVEHKDGTKEYIEVKGFETPEWRLKWKLFEALYSHLPDTVLSVVK